MWAAAAVASAFLFHSPEARAQGSICAEGGGSLAADDWAAPAFSWMLRQAKALSDKEGGTVRVVVLGSLNEGEQPPTEADLAHEQDGTLEQFKSSGFDSVQRFYVNAANAAEPPIVDAVKAAHVVWLRGGSQSRYCQHWKGTPLESAIRGVFARGGVVGGTSAGCAVLGEFIYDAAGGSCEASDALRDPFAKEISFTSGFLELTPGVIFDSHFTERARIARLPVFLARLRIETGRHILGVGMDTRTALCIGPDGSAQVFGTGAACFMNLTAESRMTIAKGDGQWPVPPAVTDIEVRQIVAGEQLNIRALTEALEEPSPNQIVKPSGPSGMVAKETDRPDGLFVRGDATQHAQRGRWFVPDEAPKQALWEGTLGLRDGTAAIPGALFATRSLALKDRTQNAAGGVLWGLTTSDAKWGSFMDAGAALRVNDDGHVQAYFPHGKLGAAMSAPVFVKSEAFGAGPRPPGARQSCSFHGLRMHLLAPGWSFDPQTGAASPPSPAAAESGPAATPDSAAPASP